MDQGGSAMITTPYSLTVGRGNVKASQYDYVWRPNKVLSNTGVVLCHGSNNPQEYATFNNLGSAPIPGYLAWHGIPSVAAEMDNQAWGNDTAMADITTAAAYMAAQTGVSATSFILLGVSMGGLTAIRYSILNPGNVRAVVGIIPLTNLVGFYNNNVGGSQAEIGTAWGVTAPAALPASADVQAQGINLTVPARIYYSHTDTTVQPADTIAFCSAVNHSQGIVPTDVGANGHSEATIADVDNLGAGQFSDTLAFIQAHL